MVPMGKIVAPFGINGWVKIKTDTETPESLGAHKELYLLINEIWILKTIEDFFAKENTFHAKLNQIDDRDAALSLKGVLVGVPKEKLPKLVDNEYYWIDLIGLNVLNKNQLLLGRVDSLMETGANAVLVVKDETQQRLIPFVAQYVLDVDLTNQQIIVDWETDYDN